MSDQFTAQEKNQALFFQLIMSFQAAAMQQMGKMKNPFTEKIERDMTQAQLSIDMIDMLKIKTEGNRTDDESKFLDQVIRELKMNYVEEHRKDNKSQPNTAKSDSENHSKK